jgi:hypothetical protein
MRAASTRNRAARLAAADRGAAAAVCDEEEDEDDDEDEEDEADECEDGVGATDAGTLRENTDRSMPVE